MSRNPHDRFDPALGAAIGFDARDLEANQRGELTPGQTDALNREHVQMTSQSKSMSVVMMVFIGAILSFGMVSAAREGGPALIAVGMTSAISMLVMGSYFLYYRRVADVRPTFQVQMVEGTVRRQTRGKGFQIHIGNVTFNVFHNVHDAFTDGHHYRIHYINHATAHWLKPISAERVSEP